MGMNKAVVLVGGPSRATRFRPLSMNMPQPLFPVGGQPIIWHQINALAKVDNLKEIILVGFFEDHVFASFLDRCSMDYPHIQFRYLREYTQLGTAGGMFHFRDQILQGSPENVLVLYTDICSNFPLNELLKAHEKNGYYGTIMATKVLRGSAPKYGCLVVDPASSLVLHYVEKPETYVSDLVSTGVFIFRADIFGILGTVMKHKQQQEPAYWTGEEAPGQSESGPEQLRLEQDVLRYLVGEKQLGMYQTTGFWRQIKSAASAVPANAAYLELAKQHGIRALAQNRPDGPKIVGAVYIHPSAQVDATAKLGPNVSILGRARVGPGARIRDAIILDNVVVKKNAAVLHAIVGWNSRIGRWARVEGSPFVGADDIEEVTHSGVKVNNICILGQDVVVQDEVFVRNSIVLPHKSIASNQHNEILM